MVAADAKPSGVVHNRATTPRSQKDDPKTIAKPESTAKPPIENSKDKPVTFRWYTPIQKILRFPGGVAYLFSQARFRTHRLVGAIFLIQYLIAVPMYLFDYERYLQSPLVWSVPITGAIQSLNAATTFTFLPKTDIPGFAAVADKSVLSYYTVVENGFYALQLVFVTCYLREDLRAKVRSLIVVEPYYCFFVFYLREVLWHSSRISSALKSTDKTTTEKNRLIMIVSAYGIKCFYLFAKHFVGFLPNYMIFLGRLTWDDQRLLYGVQVLSAYAATVSIFIHTLKFKGYIGPITALVAYDIIIPGFAYLYFNMSMVIMRNWDLAALCAVSLFMNLVPRWCGNTFPMKYVWHFYQFAMMVLLYFGRYFGCQLRTGPVAYDDLQFSWKAVCDNKHPDDRDLKTDLIAVGSCLALIVFICTSGAPAALPKMREFLRRHAVL